MAPEGFIASFIERKNSSNNRKKNGKKISRSKKNKIFLLHFQFLQTILFPYFAPLSLYICTTQHTTAEHFKRYSLFLETSF